VLVVKKILILGGTGEARTLAAQLVALGHDVTTSLAGRTQSPLLPAGHLRVGKFGGIPGLAGYLTALRFNRLVDATHPYAGLISINAVAAAQQTGVPLVRFMRPAWEESGEGTWTHVGDVRAAAAALPSGATALVTTGHDGLEAFFSRNDCTLLVRLIEPPETPLPSHARLILARPPYSLADETALFLSARLTHLVTKNSGGPATAAKLEAAHALGVPVIMIARAIYPPATEVATLEDAITALHLDGSG
jgi:precorrin-6A/cobalt-precorrin-6A reductase